MYQAPEINVWYLHAEDIVRTSGEISSWPGDENVDDDGWT